MTHLIISQITIHYNILKPHVIADYYKRCTKNITIYYHRFSVYQQNITMSEMGCSLFLGLNSIRLAFTNIFCFRLGLWVQAPNLVAKQTKINCFLRLKLQRLGLGWTVGAILLMPLLVHSPYQHT